MYSFLKNAFVSRNNNTRQSLLSDIDVNELGSSFRSSLKYLHNELLIEFDYEETILYEFRILSEELKKKCHQLDKSRKTIQFAETDNQIGQELILAAQFIRLRYHCHQKLGDTWVALMGLLMIVLQVLKTETEVQQQLFHGTGIGREIILNMNHALKNKKKRQSDFSPEAQRELIATCLDEDDNNGSWFDVFQGACSELARLDSRWENKNEYEDVVLMAKEVFNIS